MTDRIITAIIATTVVLFLALVATLIVNIWVDTYRAATQPSRFDLQQARDSIEHYQHLYYQQQAQTEFYKELYNHAIE